MSGDRKQTLHKLCEQVATGPDPGKVLELTEDILRLTDPKRAQPSPDDSGADTATAKASTAISVFRADPQCGSLTHVTRDRVELRQRLEETLAKLQATTDPLLRRDVLNEMRTLLSEAERATGARNKDASVKARLANGRELA